MAVKTTASGKMDKRTKEYKELKDRLAKARAAKAKSGAKKTTSTLKKTKSGKVDKRTKEGKAICERMAKARKAQNSLANRIKRLFR
ncbi:MAG: hypothetical protein K2J65_01215 [Duncaniella sp.]|nr:hypothetical protein [Duncaniella sp.]MDE7146513.1 hypothetical protein [Duncaniella sp.]